MEYKAPSSIDEAVMLLAQANGRAHVLAGGTDLLVQIRAGFTKPTLVVDVKNILELRTISVADDGVCIGAAVTGAELGEHDAVKAAWKFVQCFASCRHCSRIGSRKRNLPDCGTKWPTGSPCRTNSHRTGPNVPQK